MLNSIETKSISVVAIDDHQVVLQGLSLLLDNESDILLKGVAKDVRDGLELIEELSPDIAVVDLSLYQSNGLDLIKDSKIQFPNTEIIVLSMHNEMVYAERAIQAGALGYIMKDELLDKVVEGIRAVHNKQLFVSDHVKNLLLQQSLGKNSSISALPVSQLSDRELEVFTLIGEGKRPRHIADLLNMSPKTVASYCGRIRDKMNIQNMDELISRASEWVKTQL